MRSRDDPTASRRGPTRRRRRSSTRKRTRSRRGIETPSHGRRRRIGPSPILVPCATLAALVAVAILAAVRAASGPLGEWALPLAVCLGVAGCWAAAIAVAHVAAKVAAGVATNRSGARR